MPVELAATRTLTYPNVLTTPFASLTVLALASVIHRNVVKACTRSDYPQWTNSASSPLTLKSKYLVLKETSSTAIRIDTLTVTTSRAHAGSAP